MNPKCATEWFTLHLELFGGIYNKFMSEERGIVDTYD